VEVIETNKAVGKKIHAPCKLAVFLLIATSNTNCRKSCYTLSTNQPAVCLFGGSGGGGYMHAMKSTGIVHDWWFIERATARAKLEGYYLKL
jgi:hypothetical protein